MLRGILAAGPLVDRDGRLQALDQINVGPFQLMQKLPGVDRQAFDILPLPLGEERVESQRAFPEPLGPVMTTRRSRGMSRSTFCRLWTRAPRMRIDSPPPVSRAASATAG